MADRRPIPGRKSHKIDATAIASVPVCIHTVYEYIDWSNCVTVNSACFFFVRVQFFFRSSSFRSAHCCCCCAKDFSACILPRARVSNHLFYCMSKQLASNFTYWISTEIIPEIIFSRGIRHRTIRPQFVILQRTNGDEDSAKQSGVYVEWNQNGHVHSYSVFFFQIIYKRKRIERKAKERTAWKKKKTEPNVEVATIATMRREWQPWFLWMMIWWLWCLRITFSCWVCVFFFARFLRLLFSLSLSSVRFSLAPFVWLAHRAADEKLEIKASNKNSTRQKPHNKIHQRDQRTELLTCQNRKLRGECLRARVRAGNKNSAAQAAKVSQLIWFVLCCANEDAWCKQPVAADAATHTHTHTPNIRSCN